MSDPLTGDLLTAGNTYQLGLEIRSNNASQQGIDAHFKSLHQLYQKPRFIDRKGCGGTQTREIAICVLGKKKNGDFWCYGIHRHKRKDKHNNYTPTSLVLPAIHNQRIFCLASIASRMSVWMSRTERGRPCIFPQCSTMVGNVSEGINYFFCGFLVSQRWWPWVKPPYHDKVIHTGRVFIAGMAKIDNDKRQRRTERPSIPAPCISCWFLCAALVFLLLCLWFCFIVGANRGRS